MSVMTAVNAIPVFKLYGEQESWLTPDMLHCESIAVRSQMHDWHIKPHRHNGLFQILYLQDGHADIQLDDAHHAMHAGQILLVPPLYIHGFRFSRNAQGMVLTLAHPLFDKLTAQLGDAKVALGKPSILALNDETDGAYIRAAMGALDVEYKRNASYRSTLIESLLGAILIWLARNAQPYVHEAGKDTGKGAAHFANFCRLIEQGHCTHHEVAYYAKKVGISAAHLNVLCRQTANKSALELIHERLILEAKRNLVYTTMSISEASYAIGFSDPAYFTRFFKRHTGLSPKDFRTRAGTLFEPAK